MGPGTIRLPDGDDADDDADDDDDDGDDNDDYDVITWSKPSAMFIQLTNPKLLYLAVMSGRYKERFDSLFPDVGVTFTPVTWFHVITAP